jgi:hypothetical protein
MEVDSDKILREPLLCDIHRKILPYSEMGRSFMYKRSI